ncbi:MAG: glycosyltransferase [Aggregatilineales bacterium]
MDSITFSVLICTYNRHEILAMALKALIDQTAEKPDEVVVVNGGDERADAVVNSFTGRPGVAVRLVKTINKNLATSRNIGIVECRGEVVAMTDDDAEVFPDWVTQIKRVYKERPQVGAVGGAILGADSQHSFLSRLSDVAIFPSPPKPGSVRTLPGVNVSYRREVLDRVGPQDVSLFRGEDVDFNWRVKRLGYDIYYDPAIKVLHHHRPSLRKFWRQTYMYGRAYFLVRRKWPDLYCVYPHRLNSFRSCLKLVHFGISTLYQPAQTAMKLSNWTDRIRAVPILIINDAAWKSGVAYQGLLERGKRG